MIVTHWGALERGAQARFAALESWARERLPQMGSITHRWSGQAMEPADYLGFVGRNGSDQHRYIVTGDSGQGITNGVIGSLLISNLVVDGNNPWTGGIEFPCFR